ncbi:hypothetical protein [Aliiroseovarius sp.]|uniref:hypothetical protein n=1 Tax=Aliiroseovarius sp. TaxID=1872442 RepID=UPI00262677BF|nr:hypothetical protein [Aliiroseovarius sp.]
MTSQRIILHPGFHKTGTTTVQKCLHMNGPQIWPSTALGLGFKFPDLLHASRGFSTWRDPFTLEKFALRMGAFLAQLDLPPDRKLVISAEELAGHLPGRRDVPDYSALPELMARAVEVFEAQYPHGIDLTICLSTRAADTWLDSAWAEHVKASRMVLDLDAFRARHAAAADLGGMVAAVRDAVDHPVVSWRLEDTWDMPLGPAQPLIDLIGLPPANRAAMIPAPEQNARMPREVLEEMLELNRSDLEPDALKAAKQAAAARHAHSARG